VLVGLIGAAVYNLYLTNVSRKTALGMVKDAQEILLGAQANAEELTGVRNEQNN
jgi:hypothetical protein